MAVNNNHYIMMQRTPLKAPTKNKEKEDIKLTDYKTKRWAEDMTRKLDDIKPLDTNLSHMDYEETQGAPFF